MRILVRTRSVALELLLWPHGSHTPPEPTHQPNLSLKLAPLQNLSHLSAAALHLIWVPWSCHVVAPLPQVFRSHPTLTCISPQTKLLLTQLLHLPPLT